LAAYYVMTLAYSLYLKRVTTVDVMLLASMYTMRIAAGATAISVPLSPWLLAFSVFFFINLAYLKRYIELAGYAPGVSVPGRGYAGVDTEAVYNLGTGTATTAVLLFTLYLNSPEVVDSYSRTEPLWLVAFLLLYWTHRLWINARRSRIHDDPIVFALKDRVSLGVGTSIVGLVVLAYYLP
jgi:4-hydroxybenzoate polyprenyltransferase